MSEIKEGDWIEQLFEEKNGLKWIKLLGFSASSVDKESACNAGDTGSIPGSGRSTGAGIGYPLQCSWASLVSQLVNNLPAMQETWVQSLVWEDLLEKGKATHSSILAWRIPGTLQSMRRQRVRHDWAAFTFNRKREANLSRCKNLQDKSWFVYSFI